MGKTVDPPLFGDLAFTRRSKKLKKVHLTLCSGTKTQTHCLENVMPLLSPPKPILDDVSRSQAICSLGIPKASSTPLRSRRGKKPSTTVFLDLPKLLSLDVVVKEFLLPHFSFKDVTALEATCKSIKDTIRSNYWWRNKVEVFRRTDDKGDRILSRLSSNVSSTHPDYHKRQISKLMTGLNKVSSNIRDRSCRKHQRSYWLESTCHRAFTIHNTGQFVFVLNDNSAEVLEVVPNKSKRGVELEFRRSFDIVQMEHYCSILVAHRDLLFHVTHQQFHVWDWKTGLRQDIVSPSEKELLGLGIVKSVVVNDNWLIIGSNNLDQLQEPALGNAQIQIWKFAYPNLTFEQHEKLLTIPPPITSFAFGLEHEAALFLGVKATAINLDLDGDILAVGYGFYYRFSMYMYPPCEGRGRTRFYDLSGSYLAVAPEEEDLNNNSLISDNPNITKLSGTNCPAAVSCIKVNSKLRKAVVGYETRHSQSLPYLELIDIDTGLALKAFNSSSYSPRCLWTDWKQHIFSGDDDGLLVWEFNFTEGCFERCQEAAVSLSGCNGLPATDRICDVFFDGSHVILFTRGSSKATVRLLDFLKLSSTKF